MTSDNIWLHKAAYGFIAITCCLANCPPNLAALLKSSNASSSCPVTQRSKAYINRSNNLTQGSKGFINRSNNLTQRSKAYINKSNNLTQSVKDQRVL